MNRHCLGCRTVIASGSYCQDCQPRNGRTRAWRKTRERVLARDHGLCVVCGAPATAVDHVQPVSEVASSEFGNLRSLCDEHHAERHRSTA
jgi:5-methylcytosine-specific restriction endonuclease McrA